MYIEFEYPRKLFEYIRNISNAKIGLKKVNRVIKKDL
jgi:hypothetical protein